MRCGGVRAHEPRIVAINNIDALSGLIRDHGEALQKYTCFFVQFSSPINPPKDHDKPEEEDDDERHRALRRWKKMKNAFKN